MTWTGWSAAVQAQPGTWEKLNKEGEEYYYKSEYQKAKETFIKGIAAAEKEFGKNHASYATACDNLAFINSMLGDYKVAEGLFLESKSIRERVIGKSHPDYATTCVNLADVYNAEGRYAEAEKLYLEAEAVFKKATGETSIEYALVINNLAGLYFVLGDYAKTESLYLKARDIWSTLNGKESADYATACNNLGNVYQQMGDYPRAEASYLEALRITAIVSGKEDPVYATYSNNLGDVYREQEELFKAEALTLRALEIRNRVLGAAHPLTAQSSLNLGLIYQDMGQYAKAEQYMMKGRQGYVDAVGKGNVEYGAACNLMGGLYRVLGNYAKAEEMFLEGIAVFARALGEEHSDYAQACNDLAGFYRSQGRFAEAETLYRKALAVRKKIYGSNHPSYGATCNNLGLLYYDMRQYDKVEPLYKESLDIILRQFGTHDAAYGRNRNNMGQLYAMEGRSAEAEPLLMEAKQNYGESLGKDHPDYAQVNNNLANFYVSTGRYAMAEPLFNEVKDYQLKQIERNFKSLSENEQLMYYQSIKSTINGYSAFAVRYYPQKPAVAGELYDLRLATKGLIFRGTVKTRRKVLESGDTTLIRKLETTLALRNYLAKVYRMPLTERAKKNIDLKALEERANAMEKELNEQASRLGISGLEEEQPIRWMDVKGKLGKKEAAVEIIRIQTTRDTLYAALVVRPGDQANPELIRLGHPKSLEGRDMNLYRNSIMNLVDDDRSYDAFWRPLSEKLKGVKKVFISADGIYHQINLSTLKNPKTGRYLGDEVTIQVVGSTRDLVGNTKSSPPGKVGLFGFPSYQGEQSAETTDKSFASPIPGGEWSRYVDTQTGSVPTLPGTREEVYAIQRLLQGHQVSGELYTGDKASESQLKATRDPRILHIATHGFFLPGVTNSGLGSNPLLRAGLLLADCERALRGYRIPEGEEDGILSAYEAMNLFLDGTDLVVLSACETGLGEIQNGEGVYGLQRAFQQAGARAVVISLWKVDDATTELLMTNFYSHFLKSGDKLMAMTAAQKAVRARFPQPYNWGAFVLTGK